MSARTVHVLLIRPTRGVACFSKSYLSEQRKAYLKNNPRADRKAVKIITVNLIDPPPQNAR